MTSSAPVQAVKKAGGAILGDMIMPGLGTANAVADSVMPQGALDAGAPPADTGASTPPVNANAPTLDQEIGKSAAAASITRSGNAQDIAGDSVMGKRKTGAAARALGQA